MTQDDMNYYDSISRDDVEFLGGAVEDSGETMVLVDPPVPVTINDQGQITHGYAVIPQPAPIVAPDGKIFGIEPLYLGIAAVALLFLFSSK